MFKSDGETHLGINSCIVLLLPPPPVYFLETADRSTEVTAGSFSGAPLNVGLYDRKIAGSEFSDNLLTSHQDNSGKYYGGLI